jgi:hypothetical protein
MRHSIVVSLFLSLLAVNSFSQKTTDKPKSPVSQAPVPSAPVDSSNRLPVKRVVLYKNGMGYFEHTAQVRGTQDLSIDFTTSQLNDVLKSLTAVDLGEGRVSSVRYNSIAPLTAQVAAAAFWRASDAGGIPLGSSRGTRRSPQRLNNGGRPPAQRGENPQAAIQGRF